MSNHNLDILLEKSNQVALGIRARQTGITLKEYFLTHIERTKNILKSQKTKLNEAMEKASMLANDSNKKSSVTSHVFITNRAGKDEKKVLCTVGMTAVKVYKNLKNIAGEIYTQLKYRGSQILKYSTDGIKKAKLIIKGKATRLQYEEATTIKKFVVEYVSLLNSSLSEMRELFKAFREAVR